MKAEIRESFFFKDKTFYLKFSGWEAPKGPESEGTEAHSGTKRFMCME